MTSKQAVELIGCSYKTLERYRNRGILRCNKVATGRVYWFDEDIYALIGKRIVKKNREVAIYCRVSGHDEKAEEQMREQKERLRRYCEKMGIAVHRMYEDYGVASDLSESNRPAFHQLFQAILRKEISSVVVDTKCRLIPFYWAVLETFFRYHGVKVVVFNNVFDNPLYRKELGAEFTNLLVETKVSSLAELSDNTGKYDESWQDIIDLPSTE